MWYTQQQRCVYLLLSRFWCRYRLSTRSLIWSRFLRTCCRGNQCSRCKGRSKCTTGSWKQKEVQTQFLIILCMQKMSDYVNTGKKCWQVVYLQKTLNILQQVESTVTAIVLKGNFAIRAFHLIRTKIPWWSTTGLPFWLQVPEGQIHAVICTFVQHKDAATHRRPHGVILTRARVWRLVHEEKVWGNPL